MYMQVWHHHETGRWRFSLNVFFFSTSLPVSLPRSLSPSTQGSRLILGGLTLCCENPIFKSGDKSDIKNYRPVSISSIVPKLFEDLVSRQLYPILSNIIVQNQLGFMKHKSTAANLISFSEYVSSALEEGYQVDCVYTDFSKCFDKINHNLLVSKLKAIGVIGNLLNCSSQ